MAKLSMLNPLFLNFIGCKCENYYKSNYWNGIQTNFLIICIIILIDFDVYARIRGRNGW